MRAIFLILLFCFASSSLAQSDEELQTLEERGYGFYVPSGYDGSEALPLVIALHGFGDEWRNFSRGSGWISIAEEYHFLVAFPNGYLRQWNDGGRGDHYEDDVRMLQVMIERVARDYSIDRQRIYLVGFSNGGTMVYKAACESPNVYAGIAAVGGTMRYNQDCPNEIQPNVMIVHGTEDRAVPFDGGNGRYSIPRTAAFWTAQNGCETEGQPAYSPNDFVDSIASYHYADCAGGEVMLYVIEGFHHSWPGAFDYLNGSVPEASMDAPRLIWAFFEQGYEAEATPEKRS